MIIKEFAKVGAKIGVVAVTHKSNGYTVEIKKDGWDVICSTQRSEVRYWKSLDVLRKHLASNGFRGLMKVSVDIQADLF